ERPQVVRAGDEAGLAHDTGHHCGGTDADTARPVFQNPVRPTMHDSAASTPTATSGTPRMSRGSDSPDKGLAQYGMPTTRKAAHAASARARWPSTLVVTG